MAKKADGLREEKRSISAEMGRLCKEGCQCGESWLGIEGSEGVLYKKWGSCCLVPFGLTPYEMK